MELTHYGAHGEPWFKLEGTEIDGDSVIIAGNVSSLSANPHKYYLGITDIDGEYAIGLTEEQMLELFGAFLIVKKFYDEH